ncbi:hypothetical protein BD324DRAFT_403007 [Kockovaella imperatae]|uniref:Uncharacterized protein n=1 Tax=Kockovaella imperatae TaxID=4999 RepID=A0A1Y1UL75_9TREE|nr:hypothetical protein BD324DRAFT_403007 [Kockovaella imperatae]ORX37855.1 hypothetical protein BD324DRAFT_403007 [Kockovaella imperatae]
MSLSHCIPSPQSTHIDPTPYPIFRLGRFHTAFKLPQYRLIYRPPSAYQHHSTPLPLGVFYKLILPFISCSHRLFPSGLALLTHRDRHCAASSPPPRKSASSPNPHA